MQMEAQCLPSSSPSQRQAQHFQLHSSVTLRAAAADASAASRQRVAPTLQHRWLVTFPRSCGGRRGVSSGGSSCCWGLSARRCCSSTSGPKKSPPAFKRSRTVACTTVCPSLMARRHVLLAFCFLLSASVTFLQQVRLIQASRVVSLQPGEGHSKSEGGGRREGVTIRIDNAISESEVYPVSKGSHGGYSTDSKNEAAHTSTNGSSGSGPTRHAGSVTGDDNLKSSPLDGPLRSTTSIQSNATTVESSGSSAPPRSLRSSAGSSPTTAEEEVVGEERINNRSGVWVPNAVEEDTLSGHREVTEKEANSRANDTEEEYGDVLDLTVEGQPLATEESKDALNFSDLNEEGAEQASLPRSKSVRLRLPPTPEELSEQFFTGKDSLLERLYERAGNQVQEEEETNPQQQQQSDEQQQQQQSHNSGSVWQQHVQPGQPHASGGSHAVSITEDFPQNSQPTDEPAVKFATPKDATGLRLKAASFMVRREGSKDDSALAALCKHSSAAARHPESGAFQENATNGEAATTTQRGLTCSRPRSLSLPAATPEAPDKRADDGGRETSNTSKAAEQGQAERHTTPDADLTTASAVTQRRPPPLRLRVQEDSPGAAEEKDTEKSPSLQKHDRFAAPAPVEGVNDNENAPTENGKHQAGPAEAQQQQSKGAEGGVSAPTQDNTETLPHAPSVEGMETAKQQLEGVQQPQTPQQQGLLQEGEKEKGNLEKGSKANGQIRKPTILTVFAARRMAERWEPCGRWTNFVFIFVNPLSGDGSGAQWISRVDSHGHYQTSFRDICTRVHLYNLRHGAGGAPAGFQLLQRIAAAKHVLSVSAAGEAKLMSLKSLVPSGVGTPTAPVSGNNFASSIYGAAGAGAAAAADGRAGAGEHRHSHMRAQALVRAIAVGGDGTVSWVNRAASEAGVRPEWIAIGVVGFGTGNDFAQSYGWGNTEYAVNIFKGDLLKQYVLQWQAAQVAPHDVWRVNVKTLPNGYFEHIDSSTRTFKKILSETTLRPSTVLSGYMSLYFGIGFEALLGLTFDMSRSTSRLRNRMLYGFAFFKHFNKPWRLVTDQIESVYVFEDNQKKVLFTTNPVKYSLSFRLQPAISMTFLGTETILGGIKMWAHSRRVGVAPPLQDNSYLRRKYETFVRRLINVRQDMGDQKLELMSFRDRFSLMRSVMYEQNAASRLMQHRGPFYVKFYPAKISGPVPFQVDGEFFLGHNVVGAEVKYETTFYVLKQADRRSPTFRVTNLLGAFSSGEKRLTGVDQRLFSRNGLWGP